VRIDGRYKYQYGNGINTSICNIEIANFTSIDAAVWHCSKELSSEVEFGPISRNAGLTLTQKSTAGHPIYKVL